MMRIGAHVSIAGGIQNAPSRAAIIGANCAQIFVSAPQAWRTFNFTFDQIKAFRENAEKLNIEPIFIHALYLVNFTTDNLELYQKSHRALVSALNLSVELNCAGVILHLGSRKEQDKKQVFKVVIERIKKLLSETNRLSILVIENNAGEASGRKVGVTFDEIGRLLNGINSNRVKVCLDTQHAFAAGYDERTPETVKEMISEFDQKVGFDQLVTIHANDSKVELGGNRDRHENIGEGYIGKSGFKALLHDSKLRSLPWIIETPGMDGHSGPDEENIRRMKEYAGVNNSNL